VLVIEDDKFLQRLLVMKLAQDGFDVVGASDGEDGLRRIVTEPPDLVVLDLILPKMDGFEVLTQMRTNSQTRDIPVIVLSNLGQEEDVSRVKQLGAMEFLTKSDISIHEVVQKIKEALARHLSQKK
jgi:DNA-binding response OmpR family regulator